MKIKNIAIATVISIALLLGSCSQPSYLDKKFQNKSKPEKTFTRKKNIISKSEILESREFKIHLPKRVGVMLPSNDSLTEISAAIRDGIISAWYESQDPKPKLFFYSSDQTEIKETLKLVERDKIELLIGPIQKKLVQEIKNQLDPNIESLALNSYQDDSEFVQSNRYQFSLSPEEESVQVAKISNIVGSRAMIIYEDNVISKRIKEAFIKHWGKLDEMNVSEYLIEKNNKDISRLVKKALLIDESLLRQRKLTQLLGQKVIFEPRRRRDIEVIILAVEQRHAAQILPQLRYFKADGIPIFSTSHSYIPFSDSDEVRDLDGLIFTDANWFTSKASKEFQLKFKKINHPAFKYPRLFAFGRDAFKIVPFLKKLKQSSFMQVPGATGNLWSDNRGVIHRELSWFTIKRGRLYSADGLLQTYFRDRPTRTFSQ